MSGKKRASPGADEKKAPSVADLSDEQVQLLEDAEKAMGKAELVLNLRALRFMIPHLAERRKTLKKIHNFWPKALFRHSLVALHTQHAADQDALTFLEDLWVERDEAEPRAFKIEFYFKENPYFKESVLVKDFKYVPPPASGSSAAANEDGLTEANIDFNEERDIAPQTFEITWKSDSKNLVKLHPRVGGEEEDDAPSEPGSFFNLFTIAEDPFDLGQVIANDVYDDAINYYLGNVEGDIGEDEDMTDSEEELENDADEEIDLEKPKKKVKLSKS